MIECIMTNTLTEAFPIGTAESNKKIEDIEVFLINEGQFFPDLLNSVLRMVDKDMKRVYVCGLDGDFKRRSFGQITELVPHADSVMKLKSLCVICKNGTPALFSHRIDQENQQVKVLGSDAYQPLCRMCYNRA